MWIVKICSQMLSDWQRGFPVNELIKPISNQGTPITPLCTSVTLWQKLQYHSIFIIQSKKYLRFDHLERKHDLGFIHFDSHIRIWLIIFTEVEFYCNKFNGCYEVTILNEFPSTILPYLTTKDLIFFHWKGTVSQYYVWAYTYHSIWLM